MNTAEWILVVILSITLLMFLILGIVLIVRLIDLSKEVKKVVIEGQDIAKNTNGIVSNVKGMTSIGGTMEMFVDKYITPKLKEKIKERKKDDGRKTEE
ncbi:MAG: hypothetical protein Q4C24_01895 [Candidatus Saccharibacteria bacterium]|uniref:DUF948 domain-containing protein n=1 Tax=Candidatus Nanosyncoccus alces TaxID=2171997 RepID=A0ABY0FNX4_9BACT|nr:hypothetical protein [Candidatus Nanosyncoccus alces]MBQ2643627.1 hypothetical protein [Candidatus Saccharibacteria bacterium]MDO4399023.1 hypothetical protein [Candidatus Saccharibacteria bacterium]RYC74560.1 hypothetical protein G3RUM_00717 [Candidatus Nanosyncoccus alces]